MAAAKLVLALGPVDLQRGELDRAGRIVRLTSRESSLLAYLAARPGAVVPRAELLREVFGVSERVKSRTVDATMARLRQKVEVDPADPDHLRTIVGRGIQFVPLVPSTDAGSLTLGRRRFDPESGTLFGPGDVSKALTAKQVLLLTHLGAARGEPVSTDDLIRVMGAPTRRALTTAIYRLRTLLEDDPRHPVHLRTVPEGYRLVAHHPGTVPRVSGPLFGREALLEDLLQRLETRSIQLVGPGGIGKTRLSRELAERLPDTTTVAWVDLESADDPDGARESLAAALDVAPAALDGRLAAFDGVLFIDDARDAHALEPWLGGLRVVLTTRAALTSLDAFRLDVPPLAAADATALFTHEAGVPPDAPLSGPPLEVLLAARRVRRTGNATEASIEAAWTGLSARARSVWAQASVFVGGFDLNAAESVLECPGWVVDALEELVDAAILVVERTPAGLRYHLHSKLKSVGATHLDDPSRRQTETRLVGWAARLARRHEVWVGIGAHESDLPNLRKAHRLAPLDPDITRILVWPQQQLHDADAALALCAPVLAVVADPPLLIEKAGVLIGKLDLDGANAALDAIPDDASPTVLAGRAWLRALALQHTEGSAGGAARIEEGLALSEVDPMMRQCLLLMRADVATADHDADTAERLALEALALGGNPAQALLRLAHAAELRGELDEAIGYLEEILDRPIDAAVRTNAGRMLGQIQWRAGRDADAERTLLKSLERSRTLGQAHGLGGALIAMVRFEIHRDGFEAVLPLCAEALQHSAGPSPMFAVFHAWSAAAAARLGDVERARLHAATYVEWTGPGSSEVGFFAVLRPLWDSGAPRLEPPDTTDGRLAAACVAGATGPR